MAPAEPLKISLRIDPFGASPSAGLKADAITAKALVFIASSNI
jgi:hypothetical protein